MALTAFPERTLPCEPCRPPHGSGTADERTTSARLERWVAVVSAGCLVAVSLALGVLALRSMLRLETHWDTFMYHLPFAAVRGGIEVPYQMNDLMRDFYTGFPPLPHLVQGVLWRLTGSLNATGTINYLAFALFLLFCHRRLQAPFWLVALLALTTPMVLIHATTSYVDLFANSFLALGLGACASLYLFERARDRSLIALGLLGLVAAAWSKFQLVPIVAVGLLLFVVLLALSAELTRRERLQLLGWVAAAALIAALPYLKNLVVYHNPFWPVEMPFLSEYFPSTDLQDRVAEQRPPPLIDRSQFELFFHSLFEIDHPTQYPDRERWIIDQGNAWLAFRMGGFWNVAVGVFLAASLAMPFLAGRRKGLVTAVGSLLLLCLVAVLPQSHELRYYLFLPLLWAALIGMLFPHLRRRRPRVALASLVVFAGLFLYSGGINRNHYRIERIDYLVAAAQWGASPWWDELQPNTVYCAVDMVPIGMMLTGPTMSEFTIVDRSHEDLCPPEAVRLQAIQE